MKTIAALVLMAGTTFAGDALQDLANLTAINALNNQRKSDPSTVIIQQPVQQTGISPQTLQFIQEKEAEYNKLLKKYNALLLRSIGLECSDKEAAFEADVNRYQMACSVAFPDYNEGRNSLHDLADKIYQQYQSENNPIIKRSDCPWVVYSEAARQLGIKPQATVK